MKNKNTEQHVHLKDLPRNIWAVSLTSFFMDISSEMVINILPLFLSNVLGVKTNIIGLIEGVAEATASLLKMISGWLSDKLKTRKWLAVLGYGISALAKPFFYFANTWGAIAAIRWADRVGKGVRTAPRDALVADSIEEKQRGLAFGFHRAADTLGAVVGLAVAALVVWMTQQSSGLLTVDTFKIIVLLSLVPAFAAVLTLIVGTKEVKSSEKHALPKISAKTLGKDFLIFLLIVSLFDIGNSSDAFLTLRAQERGVSVLGILIMLIVFNLVYTLISTPAGILSDRVGRKKMIVGGWLLYAIVYLGFGLAQAVWHIYTLYILYGIYYGLTVGTTKAMVADIVPVELRGTAYGTYNGIMGILDFPASLLAGILWQGVGSWGGFGPSAPFLFGASTAFFAAILMAVWTPSTKKQNNG
jgi:MFS family permease